MLMLLLWTYLMLFILSLFLLEWMTECDNHLISVVVASITPIAITLGILYFMWLIASGLIRTIPGGIK